LTNLTPYQLTGDEVETLDAPRDTLHLGVLRPGEDDARTVRTQRPGVLLAAELHLLRVGGVTCWTRRVTGVLCR
jgi:hypothetical protein